MNIFSDRRIVMTLDAGGTNFVFGAMQRGKELIKPFGTPSNANNLNKCLQTIIDGFTEVKSKINALPSAISFAFPGPADYRKGIIGDLNNLPAFRGGIALGSMLEEKFQIPVFIQNDGDLFAYGEAIGGVLNEINSKLKENNSDKRYRNLIGLTLGTGFGAGLVCDERLISGDNSMPAEIWNTGNTISPWQNTEEGVSTRAIVNKYLELARAPADKLMPRDIYNIAIGKNEGDPDAAKTAFYQFGLHLGDAIANLIMLFDSNIVIGGGLTGAKELYMPAVMEVLKGSFKSDQARLVHKLYNIDDPIEEVKFYKTTEKELKIPLSNNTILYDSVPKVAIATSRLGASEAIALGAYAYALSKLN